jgi:hypothetical protein
MLRYSPVTASISHVGRKKRSAAHLDLPHGAVGLISMADFEYVMHAIYDRAGAKQTFTEGRAGVELGHQVSDNPAPPMGLMGLQILGI